MFEVYVFAGAQQAVLALPCAGCCCVVQRETLWLQCRWLCARNKEPTGCCQGHVKDVRTGSRTV